MRVFEELGSETEKYKDDGRENVLTKMLESDENMDAVISDMHRRVRVQADAASKALQERSRRHSVSGASPLPDLLEQQCYNIALQ